MTHPFYESSIEETEPLGDYCPSVDNDPPMEPKHPFSRYWQIRRLERSKIHLTPLATVYSGRTLNRSKWAVLDLSRDGFYVPCVDITRDTAAKLLREIKKGVRRGY